MYFWLWYQYKQAWGSTIKVLAREKRDTNVRVLVCLCFNTHTCIIPGQTTAFAKFYFLIELNNTKDEKLLMVTIHSLNPNLINQSFDR